jgi:amino acid adenylation domain-containing protein
MVDQFDFILSSIVTSPDALWPPDDVQSSIVSSLPPRVPELESSSCFLHQFFETKVKEIPNAPALEYITSFDASSTTNRTWSYQQLNQESNRIVKFLRNHNTKPGSLVAICFDKCPEAIFVILGILRAQCAYVALDPLAPISRKKYILEDSKCSLVLTSHNGEIDLHIPNTATWKIIDVTQLDIRATEEVEQMELQISPCSVSYCLYTSGTTGNPKGCEITHENAVQAMEAFSIQFNKRWNYKSKWLQFASFHFDVSVLELFWSWKEGICVVLAPRDLILQDLPGFLSKARITHLDLTPSLAALLRPEEVPSLCEGVFITGGEALRQDILDAWGHKEVIHNGYGPTECTIGVTMYPRVPINGKPSNIGKQFDNVGSFVLEQGTVIPVLRGGVGELCISGKLVGKGYLNNPKLTALKFPYVKSLGERIYRTGDLVRLLHDGSFEFLGRVDDQVKLRGQRLEIGEIDSVVKEVGIVKGVSTMILLHPKQQSKQLISFVVVSSSSADKLSTVDHHDKVLIEISQHCQNKLPPYMIPTYILPISLIPLTANNKIDRAQLKALYNSLSPEDLQARSHNRLTGSLRMTQMEDKLRTLFSQYFKIEESSLTVNSSTFELGLDSISVIRFVRMLQRSGLQQASVSMVLQNPTIRKLASTLESAITLPEAKVTSIAARQRIAALSLKHRATVAKTLGVQTSEIEFMVPCTPLQEGIIAETLGHGSLAYFVNFEFVLDPNTSLQRLKAAWSKVFDVLLVLRTQFVPTDDITMQVYVRNSTLSWTSLTCDTISEAQNKIQEHRTTWIKANEKLIRTPLSILAIEAEGRSILVLNIYHAIYDGWSFPILLRLIHQTYLEQQQLTELIQFPSILHQGPLTENRNALKFWTDHIVEDWDPLVAISTDRTSLPIQTEAKYVDIRSVEHCMQSLGVGHQAIVQSCWAMVLSLHLDRPMVLGTVTSGRNIDVIEVENVIGPLFNTNLYQPNFKVKSWGDLFRETHHFNISALPFQNTPLRNVLKWIGNRGIECKLQNLFTFNIAENVSNELWQLQLTEQRLVYPVSCEVELSPGSHLNIKLVGDSQYFTALSIESMIDQFKSTLDKAIKDVHSAIPTIPGSKDKNRNTSKRLKVEQSTVLLDELPTQWSEMSLQIRQEVCQLAGIDESQVNVNQSIFELGLDSIDVIKLASRLAKKSIILRPSVIMRAQTISNMMQALIPMKDVDTQETIGTKLKVYEADLLPKVKIPLQYQSNIERVLPATPLQEAMFISMIESNFEQYYNHDILRISTGVNKDHLIASWKQVIATYPILRTLFLPIEGKSEFNLAQIVLSAVDTIKAPKDLADEGDLPKMARHITRRAADKPQGLHISVSFFDTILASYVIVSMPHALYDGWSIQLLHQAVQNAYRSGSTNMLPYDDLLEIVLTGSNLEAEVFWKDYLASCPMTVISSSISNSQKPHMHEITSKTPLIKAQEFCKKERITLHQLTLTCYSLLLAAQSRKLEVLFALVLSGRETLESQKIMFPTMNTVVFRSILHGSFRDMLQQTQHDLTNILAHQHFPLRKALSFVERTSPNLLDSMFLFQARPEISEEVNAPLYKSVSSISDVDFNVCVEAEAIEGNLIWRNAIKGHVMDAESSLRVLHDLDGFLDLIMSDVSADTFVSSSNGILIGALPAFSVEDGLENKVSQEFGVEKPAANNMSLDKHSKHEKTIISILAEISQVPTSSMSITTTIFELGLDSISAIKVSQALLKQSIKLSVSEIMRNPTVSGMINHMETLREPAETTLKASFDFIVLPQALQDSVSQKLEAMGINNQSNVERIFPATAGQVYFLSSWIQSQGTVFDSNFLYKSSMQFTRDIIQTSWSHLTKHHPILRTIFIATNDLSTPFAQVCLRDCETKVLFEDDQETITQQQKQPLSFLRATASKDSGWKFQLGLHHALYDAVSISLIVQDFELLLCEGKPVERPRDKTPLLPPALVHYVKSFWTNYLNVTRKLPTTAQPIVANQDRFALFKPALVPIVPLQHTAKNIGVSIQALILSVYAKQYHMACDSEEAVVLGIYLANRSHDIPGLASSTLPTVNILPIVVSDTSRPIEELAKQVQKDLVNMSGIAELSVTLGQVANWTDVKVCGTFNFLSLPDEAGRQKTGTKVLEDDRDETVETAVVIKAEKEFTMLDELKTDLDLSAYKVREPSSG